MMLKKYILIISAVIVIGIILLNSILDIYQKRKEIVAGLSKHLDHSGMERYSVNTTKQSDRQVPPDKIDDLLIEPNAHIEGQWSAPIDWNVISLNSVLLPDYSVMTFGTFGVEKKEDKDIRSNKELTLTDGRKIYRDDGNHQWQGHDVFKGVDWDIWNQKDGFKDETHQLFKKPVMLDSFCSIVRVLDLDRVFVLGGGKHMTEPSTDTQNATTIYNVKTRKFERSKNLNAKRWYGSVVRTGDNKLIIMGGKDVSNKIAAITPEMLDLKNFNNGWNNLDKAMSEDLFGGADEDQGMEEWNYPRAFLASDGNIVGISYNKTWVMDSNDDYRISKTGEIPLVKSGISRTLKHKKRSKKSGEKDTVLHLKLLTIGSPVGATNSAVMIGQDKVIVLGGLQRGTEYSPSNKAYLIDFSNSSKPKFKELNSMNYARSDANATILPNGNIFLNGGHSYNDLEFNNLVPEIYDLPNEKSIDMSRSHFRRNYHSSSLLLPNGTILTAGGDVWNAEIFYPPYLFAKSFGDKTILAERTEITDLSNNIKRGESTIFSVSRDNVSRVTLISTGATTHGQSSESKFRDLNFEKMPNNKVQINLTSNSNDVQNGTYMLFVLNSSGVPSNGKIVYID